jgi:hypothetical protein
MFCPFGTSWCAGLSPGEVWVGWHLTGEAKGGRRGAAGGCEGRGAVREMLLWTGGRLFLLWIMGLVGLEVVDADLETFPEF